jgi:hypothetical protein
MAGRRAGVIVVVLVPARFQRGQFGVDPGVPARVQRLLQGQLARRPRVGAEEVAHQRTAQGLQGRADPGADAGRERAGRPRRRCRRQRRRARRRLQRHCPRAAAERRGGGHHPVGGGGDAGLLQQLAGGLVDAHQVVRDRLGHVAHPQPRPARLVRRRGGQHGAQSGGEHIEPQRIGFRLDALEAECCAHQAIEFGARRVDRAGQRLREPRRLDRLHQLGIVDQRQRRRPQAGRRARRCRRVLQRGPQAARKALEQGGPADGQLAGRGLGVTPVGAAATGRLGFERGHRMVDGAFHQP